MEWVVIPGFFFLALVWMVLHFMTKWKTGATITQDDEVLLEELYHLAKRLDERMETVERLVASDHPDFRSPRIPADRELDNPPLRDLDRLMGQKEPRR